MLLLSSRGLNYMQDKTLHRSLIKMGYKKDKHDYYNGRNVIVVSNRKIIDFYTISDPLIKDIKTLCDIALENTMLFISINEIYKTFGKEVFTTTLQKDFKRFLLWALPKWNEMNKEK